MNPSLQPKIILICGTRPDAIKMTPVYLELKREIPPDRGRILLVSTGQHREMVRQVFSEFGLNPDVDLEVMQPGGSLSDLMARILAKTGKLLRAEKPNLVLVHGDTATALGASLACFYERIPIAHIEAGLRSFSLNSPFPEEMHRQTIAKLARLHFVPSLIEMSNLLREGVMQDRIHVTGNTGMDTLKAALEAQIHEKSMLPKSDQILLTLHRRETRHGHIDSILKSIRSFVDRQQDLRLFCPVHPSPEVSAKILEHLANHSRIQLSPPLGYSDFIQILRGSSFVLTDSGGVQEEAAFLGIPVLLLRDRTERTNGLEFGNVRILGQDPSQLEKILEEFLKKNRDSSLTEIDPLDQESPSRRIVRTILETVTS